MFVHLGGGEAANASELSMIPKLEGTLLKDINTGKDNVITLKSGVEELGKLQESIMKLKESGKDGGGITTLTSQYIGMVNLIDGKLIEEKKMTQYNEIIKSFERLANASTGYDKFVKSFGTYVSKFKEFSKALTGIDYKYLYGYNKYLELSVELAKVTKQTNTEKMIDNMRVLIETFMDKFGKGMEDLAKQMENKKVFEDMAKSMENMAKEIGKQTEMPVRVKNFGDLGDVELKLKKGTALKGQ
jgi:hypothetical protein